MLIGDHLQSYVCCVRFASSGVSMGNPTGDQTSFNTQPTFVVQMTDEKNETYFMYAPSTLYVYHTGENGLSVTKSKI